MAITAAVDFLHCLRRTLVQGLSEDDRDILERRASSGGVGAQPQAQRQQERGEDQAENPGPGAA